MTNVTFFLVGMIAVVCVVGYLALRPNQKHK